MTRDPVVTVLLVLDGIVCAVGALALVAILTGRLG